MLYATLLCTVLCTVFIVFFCIFSAALCVLINEIKNILAESITITFSSSLSLLKSMFCHDKHNPMGFWSIYLLIWLSTTEHAYCK